MLKTKKILFFYILQVFFLYVLCARDYLYITTNNSSIYTYKIKLGFIENDFIKKDEIVTLEMPAHESGIYFDDKLNNYVISIEYNNKKNKGEILLNNIIPCQSDSIIPDKYITNPYDMFFWIPTYYLEVIKKQDREILRKYEPEIIKLLGEPNEYEDGWYLNILQHVIISNSCISFGHDFLYIDNITQIAEGFSVETSCYDFGEKSGHIILNFVFDEDFLNVYIKGENKPIYSFFKIRKNDYFQLAEFIQIPRFYFLDNYSEYDLELYNNENSINIMYLTWPRHADGSCDYDGST